MMHLINYLIILRLANHLSLFSHEDLISGTIVPIFLESTSLYSGLYNA